MKTSRSEASRFTKANRLGKYFTALSAAIGLFMFTGCYTRVASNDGDYWGYTGQVKRKVVIRETEDTVVIRETRVIHEPQPIMTDTIEYTTLSTGEQQTVINNYYGDNDPWRFNRYNWYDNYWPYSPGVSITIGYGDYYHSPYWRDRHYYNPYWDYSYYYPWSSWNDPYWYGPSWGYYSPYYGYGYGYGCYPPIYYPYWGNHGGYCGGYGYCNDHDHDNDNDFDSGRDRNGRERRTGRINGGEDRAGGRGVASNNGDERGEVIKRPGSGISGDVYNGSPGRVLGDGIAMQPSSGGDVISGDAPSRGALIGGANTAIGNVQVVTGGQGSTSSTTRQPARTNPGTLTTSRGAAGSTSGSSNNVSGDGTRSSSVSRSQPIGSRAPNASSNNAEEQLRTTVHPSQPNVRSTSTTTTKDRSSSVGTTAEEPKKNTSGNSQSTTRSTSSGRDDRSGSVRSSSGSSGGSSVSSGSRSSSGSSQSGGSSSGSRGGGGGSSNSGGGRSGGSSRR